MKKSESTAHPGDDVVTGQEDYRLRRALLRLVDGGSERLAIEAGQIDAVIDYTDKKVILFPAAERALRSGWAPASAPDSRTNGILAALPPMEHKRLHRSIEPVALMVNQVIQESGASIEYVYFPVDCVISLLATAESSRILEVGLVGSEGMVGVSLALGANVSTVRALVSVPGRALRVPEAHFREVYLRSPILRHELNRYTYTELALARQTAACSAFHVIEQRLARRLLMIGDLVHSDRFYFTQEFVAFALGVRRVSITEAAGNLQKRGLITYSRGHIRILNRSGLESVSCSCYKRIEGLQKGVQPKQEVLRATV